MKLEVLSPVSSQPLPDNILLKMVVTCFMFLLPKLVRFCEKIRDVSVFVNSGDQKQSHDKPQLIRCLDLDEVDRHKDREVYKMRYIWTTFRCTQTNFIAG